MKPLARKERITTEQLVGETLVYDLNRHKAHCLNSTAAAVWKYCDGETGVSQMADRLHNELGVPADESIVHMALRQLNAAGLIEAEPVDLPQFPVPSRREISRRLSLRAALVLPLVTSILVPTAAQAASGGVPQNGGSPGGGNAAGGNTGGGAGSGGGGGGHGGRGGSGGGGPIRRR